MCTTCGCGKETVVELEKNILDENQTYADTNKNFFKLNNIRAYNIVASPGAGKTTLLMETADQLAKNVSVIVGDQATECDANMLKSKGIDALQIFTNKVC